MYKGSCYCGQIQFELHGSPSMMGTCHCSRCRKAGASTLLFADVSQVKVTKGAAEIRVYQPAPPFHYARSFCQHCGTALGNLGSTAEQLTLPANCLDDAGDLRNQFHVFVDSKPSWYTICDEVPRHPNAP